MNIAIIGAGPAGVMAGIAALLIHLSCLRCLDVPYIRIRIGKNRSVLRRRLLHQKYRDPAMKPVDKKNQK